MTDTEETRTKQCPSPDCDRELPVDELADHINTEHPGEYRRDDWPDTEAGHLARVNELMEEDDEE